MLSHLGERGCQQLHDLFTKSWAEGVLTTAVIHLIPKFKDLRSMHLISLLNYLNKVME